MRQITGQEGLLEDTPMWRSDKWERARPMEYAAFIDKDEIKWSRIVKASGAKGD